MQLESKVAAREAGDEPVFLVAGTAATGDFHCAECGYGITVRSLLPQCPMCRGLQWEELSTSPYRARH
jgi:lipopolysaccharide biosynthesis regulator YciM